MASTDRSFTDDDITIFVQPGRRLHDGAPRFAEVLVRFVSDELRPVPVAEIIGDAQADGSIAEIGRIVTRQAATLQSALEGARLSPDLLSINLSPSQLVPGVVEQMCETIEAAGSRPDRFAIEVPGGGVVSAQERAVVAAFKEAGITVAIDDLGTGVRSVADIMAIEPDVVKVPRSVMFGVEDLGSASLDRLVAEAKGEGLTVVVEGVESVETAHVAASSGADVAQGFYFARPHQARLSQVGQIDWRVWSSR